MAANTDAAPSLTTPPPLAGEIAAGNKELQQLLENTTLQNNTVVPVCEAIVGNQMNSAEVKVDRNGHFYMKVVDAEEVRLMKLVAQVEEELTGEQLPENISGVLRAAVGKTKLLMDKKFPQFRSLCNQNLIVGAMGTEKVTNEDLRGFWEMVTIQVGDIGQLFTEIDEMRQRSWVPPEEKEMLLCPPSANKKLMLSTPGKKIGGTPVKARSAISIKADEQRKLFMESRRQLMKQKEQETLLDDEKKCENNENPLESKLAPWTL